MHLMPWELDDAFQAFSKIASVKRNLSAGDEIRIDTCLNLSSYIINWEKSSLPKDLFIEKYNYINKILHEFTCNTFIYDQSELYGHLDFQRELVDTCVDYYMSICPDVYFHPHTIYYLIESAKQVKDKYFLITPQIPQLWDSSWNMLVNETFIDGNYENWENQNIHEIIYKSEHLDGNIEIQKTPEFKWAGWFDLYNKNFYEDLVPCFDNWHGYGPWDFFGINVCNLAKQKFKVNVEEYVLKNQIIFDKDIGIYQNKKIQSPYKKYLYLNNIPNQRINFEQNLTNYIGQWINHAKNKNII
jgi:hypothetical protein